MTSIPQEKSYSLADALSWPEDRRMELIDGQPVMMAPPSREHQRISGALFAQIHNFLQGKPCQVYAAPFAVRPFETEDDAAEEVNTMVEPDISVICDRKKLDDIGCKGAPDLVVEILSDSTRRHDRIVKYNLYQRAGIREYWIVDPDRHTVQVYVLEEGKYNAADAYTSSASVPVSVLPGCVIDLQRVFIE